MANFFENRTDIEIYEAVKSAGQKQYNDPSWFPHGYPEFVAEECRRTGYYSDLRHNFGDSYFIELIPIF